MISYIEGRILVNFDSGCIIATDGGLGYEVFLTGKALSKLPVSGEFVKFFVASVIREDAFELFGFESWDERQTFILLTSITRVGARTAMAILSVFSPDDLRGIVVSEDIFSLTRVSGIGKKTAQQIFLELKYKLKIDAPSVGAKDYAKSSVLQDTVAGLVNLGYSEIEALDSVKKVLSNEEDHDASSAIRAALKILARSK